MRHRRRNPFRLPELEPLTIAVLCVAIGSVVLMLTWHHGRSYGLAERDEAIDQMNVAIEQREEAEHRLAICHGQAFYDAHRGRP